MGTKEKPCAKCKYVEFEEWNKSKRDTNGLN